jgi:PKD repeat protein
MKNLYFLLLFLASSFIAATHVNANQVIVRGYVTSTTGVRVANWPVIVATDSLATNTSCRQSHKVYTNANGFYNDTLKCTSSDIVKVRISTYDCNGSVTMHDPQVGSTDMVESNFTICTPQPVGCEAEWSYERSANSQLARFNSSNAHGTTTTDGIVRRSWKFGDGDTLGGNVIDPSHTYAKKGVYQACLTIFTAAGCENTVCKTINTVDSIAPTATHCSAKFVYETSTSNTLSVKFNGSSSTTASGDSIRERIWKFGDGTTANTIDPTHTYTAAGVYNVCLIIRTVGGCSDTACTNITVQSPNPVLITCHSDFSYVPDASNLKFNSRNSATVSGDSIISRTWQFGDGTSLTGNVIDPSHKYAQAGVYDVCLSIKTAKGCESKECKQVTATAAATQCAPQFTWNRVSLKKVSFNSSMSWVPTGDSIKARRWNFGDGTPVSDGNVISPTKEFVRTGIYTVCLRIVTVKGCENTYCTTVKVEDSTTTFNADAIRITALYPSPVVTPLNTEVYSAHNNVNAELSIYDIYGVKKWSTNKVLLQGTNVTSIPTSTLAHGPYFFRVTTMYGVKSKQFYKL